MQSALDFRTFGPTWIVLGQLCDSFDRTPGSVANGVEDVVHISIGCFLFFFPGKGETVVSRCRDLGIIKPGEIFIRSGPNRVVGKIGWPANHVPSCIQNCRIQVVQRFLVAGIVCIMHPGNTNIAIWCHGDGQTIIFGITCGGELSVSGTGPRLLSPLLYPGKRIRYLKMKLYCYFCTYSIRKHIHRISPLRRLRSRNNHPRGFPTVLLLGWYQIQAHCPICFIHIYLGKKGAGIEELITTDLLIDGFNHERRSTVVELFSPTFTTVVSRISQ